MERRLASQLLLREVPDLSAPALVDVQEQPLRPRRGVEAAAEQSSEERAEDVDAPRVAALEGDDAVRGGLIRVGERRQRSLW